MLVRSDPWFDGTCWEIDMPSGWAVVNRSNQHLRISNARGSTLLVGFRKYAMIGPGSKRDPWASQNLSEQDEWAYSDTKSDYEVGCVNFFESFSYLFTEPDIARIEWGMLKGFVYRANANERSKVAGFLYSENSWNVYIKLECSADVLNEEETVARNVVSAIRFL